MSGAEAEASAPGSDELVDEIFSVIEEAGLTDLAMEPGMPRNLGLRAAEVDGGLSSTLMGAEPSHSALTTESQLSASQNGDSSLGGACSPPRVHMPQCSTAGPSVPADLQDMVSAVGEPPSKKKRQLRATGGKQGDKGLRHFSMKVCEKVEQKVRTTYNEVADELVAEFAASPELLGVDPSDKSAKPAGGEAGIRRRVYDALNVLMAMDIITKEKKSILWRGLPTNTEQEGARLQMDLKARNERMERKRSHLGDLVSQQVSFKQLIERNRSPPAGAQAPPPEGRIALPFIVVNTRKETVIDCEMAEDRQEIFFNFSAPFEIHDDSETLKRMNMQRCPTDRVAALVPEGLGQFAKEMLLEREPSAAHQPARGGARNGSRK